jgi:mycobactin polyketide synthetase MbtD
VTRLAYRLPNGTIPVLLSADSLDLVQAEAAALLSYATDRPEVSPQAIAGMLFRTRTTRRHRALVMVANRDELVSALKAVIDRREHPSLVRTTTPATARRLAYVFPGQGSQRPGMARLFYESVPAFRAEVDRCAEAFQAQLGESPLRYLLDEQIPADDRARTVQPALFTQMAGLAAMWQSFGFRPDITTGHSQGEIAAAYVSRTMTLADAVRVVAIRAHAADELGSGDYAMAVIATDSDTCQDALARSLGWAELSVVNSPSMVGISGDRDTVQGIVDGFTEHGTFARIIRVEYPAHTSLINELGKKMRADTQRQLENPRFLNTDTDCIGATLGGPITADLPMDQYWFWNLRNTVRFDKAIAAAVSRDVDTFIELAEHPTLQLAIEENLAALAKEDVTVVVGTASRTARDLSEFTRNFALLAVNDLDYSWDCLRPESDGPVPLPLLDFPNAPMSEVRLWLAYNSAPAWQAGQTSVAPAEEAVQDRNAETTPARLLVEDWVRLSHRALVPPRVIGIIDHTGACSDLATALCATAGDVGATACMIDIQGDNQNKDMRSDLDTQVILLPQLPTLDGAAAAAEVATLLGNRTWWPGVDGTVSNCWLVTVAGEVVVAEDPPPDPVHAAISAAFRSMGAEHPGVEFRHFDLPAGSTSSKSANSILAALHTAKESELAQRNDITYAKRLVEADPVIPDSKSAPLEHVLITGGTGKLGLEFCDHFAHRGALRITLVSRTGETAAVTDQLRSIRSATPTQIRVTKCDVSDQAAVSQLADEHQDTPADLIIHAAVAYSDIELADITPRKVDQALRAKVVGICRVLGTFPRTGNCRVVLCSSMAATVGGRGQVIYAAANRMLDAMAHQLRAEGLDCISVQWGLWTVHLDLDAAGMAKLTGTGIVPMSPADALALGMGQLRGNAIVAAFDLAHARSALEPYGYGPLLSQLTSPTVEILAHTDETDLSQRLMKLLAETIGVGGVDAIDAEAPMVAIGLDSLQALELRRRVKSEFDYDLAIADLLGRASIADVSAQLSAQFCSIPAASDVPQPRSEKLESNRPR